MKFRYFALLGFIGFVACSKSDNASSTGGKDTTTPVVTDTVPSVSYDLTLLNYSSIFNQPPASVVNFARQDYNELSGVAASQLNKGILYVHDDGKNSPIVITNAKGEYLGNIILYNTNTINPEDIAVGPGPVAGKTYIYFGDIGDNNANRSSVSIYRIEEPVLNNPTASTIIVNTAPDKLTLTYPNGAVNAESLMIDPITKDLFIASKENNKSIIYKASYPQSTTTAIVLQPVVKTYFDLLTGGDISPDGKEILLRNKGQIFYWQRDITKSVATAILTTPTRAPYAGNEPQGEGVGFASDASGYFTDTEIKGHSGSTSTLTFYSKK